MRKYLLFSFCLLCFSGMVSGQGIGINESGNDPHPSAILDVQSTSKGMLVPKMSSADRMNINNPADGLLVYDLTVRGFWFYDATLSQWVRIVRGNTILDTDEDTKIQVEETSDDDQIRFDVGGVEQMRLDGQTLHLAAPGNSVFVGENAGANDDGSLNHNTFVGFEAGEENTGGSGNTFIGSGSGTMNQDGEQNTFVGLNSGNKMVSGDFNTFLGYATGSLNVGGSSNTMIGKFAGGANSGGSQNTFLGKDAGFSSLGSSNVFLGHQAGFFETGSHRLYIDNSSTTTPLIWGDFLNDKVKIYGLLGVGDSYTFPAVDGQYGQFLQSDGSGQLSWSDVPVPVVAEVADNDGDTRIIVEDSPDEDIIRFEVGGSQVMSHDGAILRMDDVRIGWDAGLNASPLSSNTMIGVLAGANIPAGYDYCTAVGYEAMKAAGSVSMVGLTAVGYRALHGGGDFATAVGYQALLSGGLGCTAVGYATLIANSGQYNTAMGTKTLEVNTSGNYNSAYGGNAMAGNTIGFENTAVGVSALAHSGHSGDRNSALGVFALLGNSNGNDNTAVGAYADVGSGNLSNATAIGAYSTVNCSDCLVLDTDADVGVKTNSPAVDFHVVHDNGITDNGFRLENSQNGNYFRFYTSSGTGYMYVYSHSYPSTTIAEVDHLSGGWYATSDRNRKEDFSPLVDVLSGVMQLEPLSYRFVGQEPGSAKRYGFIAQDVEPLFPGLVHVNQEHGNYTMNYAEMSTLAIAAVQQQQEQIETMQSEIEWLKAEMEVLRNEINAGK
ncbi:MAG: hypothetical protein GYB31_14625 [Bacteroidetes bacterium]|nr:hypothetical protein [Bacteroidota bacterium]